MSKTTIGTTGDGSLVVSQVSTKTSVQETPSGVAIKVTEVASVTVIQGAKPTHEVAQSQAPSTVDRGGSTGLSPAPQSPPMLHHHTDRGGAGVLPAHVAASGDTAAGKGALEKPVAPSQSEIHRHGESPSTLKTQPLPEVREARADALKPPADGRVQDSGVTAITVERPTPATSRLKEGANSDLGERPGSLNLVTKDGVVSLPNERVDPKLSVQLPNERSDQKPSIEGGSLAPPLMNEGGASVDPRPSLTGRDTMAQPSDFKIWRDPATTLQGVISNIVNEERPYIGRSLQQGISQEFGAAQAASISRTPLAEVANSLALLEVRASILSRIEQIREAVHPREGGTIPADLTRLPSGAPREGLAGEVPLPWIISAREPGTDRFASPTSTLKGDPAPLSGPQAKADSILSNLAALSQKLFTLDTLKQIDRALETTCISIAALAVLGALGSEKILEKIACLGAEALRRMRELVSLPQGANEELKSFEDVVEKLQQEMRDRGLEHLFRGGEFVADIVGVVVFSGTQEPIPGVVIDGGTLGLTQTDLKGQFRFDNIPLNAGYIIVAKDARYTFTPATAHGSVGEVNVVRFEASLSS